MAANNSAKKSSASKASGSAKTTASSKSTASNKASASNKATASSKSTSSGTASTGAASSKSAMDRFKSEVASELGVNLKDGYNGDLTSREVGSVGGEMVKRMIEKQKSGMK